MGAQVDRERLVDQTEGESGSEGEGADPAEPDGERRAGGTRLALSRGHAARSEEHQQERGGKGFDQH